MSERVLNVGDGWVSVKASFYEELLARQGELQEELAGLRTALGKLYFAVSGVAFAKDAAKQKAHLTEALKEAGTLLSGARLAGAQDSVAGTQHTENDYYSSYANHCAIQQQIPMTFRAWKRQKPNAPNTDVSSATGGGGILQPTAEKEGM